MSFERIVFWIVAVFGVAVSVLGARALSIPATLGGAVVAGFALGQLLTPDYPGGENDG